MSWKATAYVKGISSGLTRSEKLIMLVLADSYSDEYEIAWPSRPRLAEWCLMSERHVERCLRSLETKGFISTVTGCGRGNSSQYKFNQIISDTLSPFTKHEKATPLEERATPRVIKGDIAVSPEQEGTNKEPPREAGHELFLEMPFLRWSRLKVFSPRKIKWIEPKWPDTFDRLEQEPARRSFLAYMDGGGTKLMEWYGGYKDTAEWKPRAPRNGNRPVLDEDDLVDSLGLDLRSAEHTMAVWEKRTRSESRRQWRERLAREGVAS